MSERKFKSGRASSTIIPAILILGISCASPQVPCDPCKCVTEKQLRECHETYNTCRTYLSECIAVNKDSIAQIDRCQSESRSRAWTAGLSGVGIGSVLVMILVLILHFL